MIRPKIHAVEGERATRKRNTRQIFHGWLFLSRIETRDTPILVRLFHAAQDVDHFIDKGVAANFRADINDAQRLSARIEFEDAMLIPLTQVKMLAVEAEIRAEIGRASCRERVAKT